MSSTRFMPVAGPHASNPAGGGTPPIVVGNVSYSAQPANSVTTTGIVDIPGLPLTGIGPSLPPGWICLGQVGKTADRPHFDGGSYAGYTYVDTDLNAILTWDGSGAWRKPDGTVA